MGSIIESAVFNDAITYITDILLILSMFGCLATVVTFLVFRSLRTQPIKLVVYLCVCIFVAQLFFFLTFYLYDTIMCIPCAMIFHYFFLADFIWTFSVAFNFYQMIVRRNRDAESLEYFYHAAAWLIPAIIVAAMASAGEYYNRGGYCYMASGIPIFLGFFVPGLFIVTANTIIFIFTVKEIHDTLKSAPNSDKKEKSKELKVYFSIFASIGLSWLFGFAMVLADQEVVQVVFLIIFSFLTPAQGFFIFVSYCCNERIVNKWGQILGFKQLIDSNATSSTASGRISSTNPTTSSHSSHKRGGVEGGKTNKDKEMHNSRNVLARGDGSESESASTQSTSSSAALV